MKFAFTIDHTTNFAYLSQFRDLRDFNNNTEMFLADYKADFTASELIALKRLTKFAAKVPGIATASINTILNAINDKSNGYGISESTFHRMKRKAVEFGMLTIKTTERIDGSQSSNVWIFNRYKVEIVADSNTNETPAETKELGEVALVKEKVVERLKPLKTSVNIKTNNINTHTYKDPSPIQLDRLDYTFIYEPKLKQFIETVIPFYADDATVKEFIKAIYQNTRKYKRANDYDFVDNATRKEINSDIETLAIDSFKRTISVIKERKNRRNAIDNPIGLFVKIFREVTRVSTMRKVFL